MPARFAPDFLLVVLLSLAAPALAQVSVQEYAIPRGHYVHDVWADTAPGGPVWFSAQRGGELGILDPAGGGGLRLARRLAHRAHRRGERRRDGDRAADAPPGRAARVGGLEGQPLGGGVELGQPQPLRAADRQVVAVEGARRLTARLR